MKSVIGRLNDLPLFLMRMVLAFGFYEPAVNKWNDITAIGDWFADLGLPAPYFQAYMAASIEMLGVILLILGLGTRIISFLLLITMLVAIKTVHWENGFSASDNGLEIPLYYLIMLFTLFVYGSGKWSVDGLISYFKSKKSNR